MRTNDEAFFNSVKSYNDSLISESVGERFGGIPYDVYTDVYAPSGILKVFPTVGTAHLPDDNPNRLIAGRYIHDECGRERKLHNTLLSVIMNNSVEGVETQLIEFNGLQATLIMLNGAKFGIKAELLSENNSHNVNSKIKYTIILEKPPLY